MEAENYLRASENPWLIFRLSKIYDVEYRDDTLITSCLDSLLSGKPVRGATDQFIAPVYVGDVCRAVDFLIQGKKRGLFHISSPQVVSRYELCASIADYFGLDSSLVHPCRFSDFNFIESRAAHYHLCSRKLQSLSFKYVSLEKAFEIIKANYKKE